jgi:hypothetical protein
MGWCVKPGRNCSTVKSVDQIPSVKTDGGQSRNAPASIGTESFLPHAQDPAIFIFLPQTEHSVPSQIFVFLPGLQTKMFYAFVTCHALCGYFITPVTQYSYQFCIAVPIYLPWTSVFTLSRVPL